MSSPARRFSTMSAKDMVEQSMKHTMFSWSAQKMIAPIPMARAKGVYFWDADGVKNFLFDSVIIVLVVVVLKGAQYAYQYHPTTTITTSCTTTTTN